MLQTDVKPQLERAFGEVRIECCEGRVTRWREAGAAKARFANPSEAILINTGGGLAGGDRFEFDFTASQASHLAITSQAAERVYRTLGPAAEVSVTLCAQRQSVLMWLPQETILFAHSSLSRQLTCHLTEDARLLCVEPVILGRRESGELPVNIHLRDRWRIFRNDQLIYADELRLHSDNLAASATLRGATAFATLVYIGDDATGKLDLVRTALGGSGSASYWSGKLVARILAGDGLMLRKALIPALHVLSGRDELPKTWSL